MKAFKNRLGGFYCNFYRGAVRKIQSRGLYKCMTITDEIEQLFRSNYKAMLVLANRLLRNEEVARDVVHDVFASLLTDKDLSSVTPAYLLTAVRFACLKHIRSLSVHERFSKLYALDNSEMEDKPWQEEEDVEKINDIIERHLPERSRRVIRLRFSDHMTYREIADELSISEVAVYKHLRHAIDILRHYFQPR